MDRVNASELLNCLNKVLNIKEDIVIQDIQTDKNIHNLDWLHLLFLNRLTDKLGLEKFFKCLLYLCLIPDKGLNEALFELLSIYNFYTKDISVIKDSIVEVNTLKVKLTEPQIRDKLSLDID